MSHDTEAEDKLRRKIADGSNDPEDYRNLSDLLFPSGRYEEAIALYQKALALPLTKFKNAQLAMEVGWLYHAIGQRDQASTFARDALSLLATEPRSAEVLYCLGASQALLAFCLSFTDPNAGADAARIALGWLEQALADSSDFEDKPYAYVDAARLHNLLGNGDRAISHCEQCLQHKVTEMQRISCLSVYVQALCCVERFGEAEQAIADLFQYGNTYKSGFFHTLYMELGQVQRFTNRLTESKRSFEQALATLKTDPYFRDDVEILGEIYFNLATVCYELGDYEEAITAYTEVLRCDKPDVATYWNASYWLGRSYEFSQNYHKARDCYRAVTASQYAAQDDKAAAQNDLMLVLAKLDYESGKYKEAAAAFEEVVSHHTKRDPHHWSALIWLSSCYEGLGEYDKARSFYEEVLASAHSSDANKEAARKRLTASLGKVYYQQSQYAEAVAAFEEVLLSCPNDETYRCHALLWLGYSCHALGSHSRARDCFEEVLTSPVASEDEKTSARKGLARLRIE